MAERACIFVDGENFRHPGGDGPASSAFIVAAREPDARSFIGIQKRTWSHGKLGEDRAIPPEALSRGLPRAAGAFQGADRPVVEGVRRLPPREAQPGDGVAQGSDSQGGSSDGPDVVGRGGARRPGDAVPRGCIGHSPGGLAPWAPGNGSAAHVDLCKALPISGLVNEIVFNPNATGHAAKSTT